MHILYLGDKSGNCKLRAAALERVGHTITHINPYEFLPSSKHLRRFHYETGGLFSANHVGKALLPKCLEVPYDLVWVDGGRWIGPKVVRELKKKAPVIDYTVDDAYGSRDRFSWSLFRKTTPEYDLISMPRTLNIEEGYKFGAKKMLLCFRTADEVAHRPRELTPEELTEWSNDVVFVGTGLDRRDIFMAELLRLKVPLAIYGPKWQSTKLWPKIQSAWRGPETQTPAEYSAAILGAKVSLGLLSKGNRDLHTRRSAEIPALGGVFCAERTSDHLEMYVENEEAVFWESAEECAEASNRLVQDPKFRLKIARQGHERCLKNGYYNEDFCVKVLRATFPDAPDAQVQPNWAAGKRVFPI